MEEEIYYVQHMVFALNHSVTLTQSFSLLHLLSLSLFLAHTSVNTSQVIIIAEGILSLSISLYLSSSLEVLLVTRGKRVVSYEKGESERDREQ